MDQIPEWTVLRPSGFNQNFSEGFLLPGIVHANAVLSATGNGKAGWVDAGDIAAVAADALTGDALVGEHLSITGPRALDFGEIAGIISSAAEREIAYRSVDEEAFRSILMSAGSTPEYAEIPVRDQRAIRQGEGAMVADTVERVTGRPALSFEDFAKRSAAIWQLN